METVLATGDEQGQLTIQNRQLSMGQLKEQKCETVRETRTAPEIFIQLSKKNEYKT